MTHRYDIDPEEKGALIRLCFECGKRYHAADGCDCEDEDTPMDWETYKRLKGFREID